MFLISCLHSVKSCAEKKLCHNLVKTELFVCVAEKALLVSMYSLNLIIW